MALYLVQLRKAINTDGIAYRWSNRYFFDVADVDAALAQGLGAWDTYEAPFHRKIAFCYEIYANLMGDAPFTPGSTLGVPVGIQRGRYGSGASDTTTILPSSNVVRVDFPVVNSRPSRKFYRLPLTEADITSGQLTIATSNVIQTAVNALADVTTIVDVDGQAYGGSAIVRGITTRRVGREAALAVPTGPAFG